MANVVTSKVLEDGARIYAIAIHNDSDGTAETLVTKVDVTTMSGYNANSSPYLNCKIETIWLSTAGNMSCKFYWAASTNKLAWIIPSGFIGMIDFRTIGGLPNENFGLAGNTGNLLMSTTGALAGDAYSLILRLVKA